MIHGIGKHAEQLGGRDDFDILRGKAVGNAGKVRDACLRLNLGGLCMYKSEKSA